MTERPNMKSEMAMSYASSIAFHRVVWLDQKVAAWRPDQPHRLRATNVADLSQFNLEKDVFEFDYTELFTLISLWALTGLPNPNAADTDALADYLGWARVFQSPDIPCDVAEYAHSCLVETVTRFFNNVLPRVPPLLQLFPRRDYLWPHFKAYSKFDQFLKGPVRNFNTWKYDWTHMLDEVDKSYWQGERKGRAQLDYDAIKREEQVRALEKRVTELSEDTKGLADQVKQHKEHADQLKEYVTRFEKQPRTSRRRRPRWRAGSLRYRRAWMNYGRCANFMRLKSSR